MFEIYREAAYNGRYKVVYFTELQEHDREFEISRAMAGEHFYDGFIRSYGKEEAKLRIQQIIERLNAGESVDRAELDRELQPFLPTAQA